MHFTNLNSLSAPRVKALFGLPPSLLAELLFVVLPELERRRTARLESRADRKRQRVANDGRPRTVTPLHKVQQEVVGALWGCSADTAENACHEVVPVLRDLFPTEKWDAEKQWRRNEPTWTPDAVDKVIIDSFESPVRRPSLQERLANKPRIGDKGYYSQDHPELITPHKKPRGGELTAEQKAENKAIAHQRIVVEHAIRQIKGFRLLRDDYRLALGLFPMIASAVVGLIQFSRIAG